MADFEKVYQIKFDTSQAITALKGLEKALDQLGKKARAVGKSLARTGQQGKKAGDTIARSVQGGNTALDRMRKKARDVGRNLSMLGMKAKSLGRSLSAAGRSMTMWVTGPIALLGGGAIKLATDYEEALDKVQVVFGSASKTVTDFTDNARKQFGLGKLTAIEMTSLFGDMATGMKIPRDEAAKLSIEMAKLAADTASLKNVPLDEIKTAFAGVFTGETESMKRIGVMLQQKNIQAWMKGEGIRGQIKDMGQAEQAVIRFRYVQDTLSNSVGNFEMTQESAANKSRTFSESISDLGITFGREILPLFVKVIDKLQKGIEWFGKLDEGTKETIIIVAGLTAALGPLLFVLGKVVLVVQALGVALKLLALNPVILAAGALVAVLGLLFVKMSTLTAYFEESITQWTIWFKEVGIVISDSVVNSLNWVLEKASAVWEFLGGDPIKIRMDAELTTGRLKDEIRILEEQKGRIDFDAAGKEDKQRVNDLMGSYGLSFDLPEGRSPVTPPSKDEPKKKRKGGKKGNQPSWMRSDREMQAREQQKEASRNIDQRLAMIRGQGGSSSSTSNVTVNVSAPINAPGGDPARIQKGIERSLSKGLERASKGVLAPAQ